MKLHIYTTCSVFRHCLTKRKSPPKEGSPSKIGNLFGCRENYVTKVPNWAARRVPKNYKAEIKATRTTWNLLYFGTKSRNPIHIGSHKLELYYWTYYWYCWILGTCLPRSQLRARYLRNCHASKWKIKEETTCLAAGFCFSLTLKETFFVCFCFSFVEKRRKFKALPAPVFSYPRF